VKEFETIFYENKVFRQNQTCFAMPQLHSHAVLQTLLPSRGNFS